VHSPDFTITLGLVYSRDGVQFLPNAIPSGPPAARSRPFDAAHLSIQPVTFVTFTSFFFDVQFHGNFPTGHNQAGLPSPGKIIGTFFHHQTSFISD
jgi:hypothetical protein